MCSRYLTGLSNRAPYTALLVKHLLATEHSRALRHDWPAGHVVDDRVALADVRRDPMRVAAVDLTKPPPRVDRRHLERPAWRVRGILPESSCWHLGVLYCLYCLCKSRGSRAALRGPSGRGSALEPRGAAARKRDGASSRRWAALPPPGRQKDEFDHASPLSTQMPPPVKSPSASP